MKKLLLAAAAIFAIAAPFAAGQATVNPTASEVRRLNVVICHKTRSQSRPYVRIRARTQRALRTHRRHPDDIIPGGRRCPRAVLTPTSGGVALRVSLTGVAERPTPGDVRGSGTATIRVRLGQGRLCFLLRAQNLGSPAVGAHIHRGSANSSGPIVVQLGRLSGTGGSVSDCVVVSRTLVRAMLRTPSLFYVNVHTRDFPGGAIRGQLALPGSIRIFRLTMTGAAERPRAGDPNGSGLAGLRIDTGRGQLCFTLSVRGIQLPTIGAHVHRGTVEEAGDIVIPLTAPGASGESSGCVSVARGLLTEIVRNPSLFYVNVHTREFPGGAVRAQLA